MSPFLEPEVPQGQTGHRCPTLCSAVPPALPGSRESQAYPGCRPRTWGRHAGSWPLEHGRDSSQGSEGSWVPGGGGECQDRKKGGPAVINETDIVSSNEKKQVSTKSTVHVGRYSMYIS